MSPHNALPIALKTPSQPAWKGQSYPPPDRIINELFEELYRGIYYTVPLAVHFVTVYAGSLNNDPGPEPTAVVSFLGEDTKLCPLVTIWGVPPPSVNGFELFFVFFLQGLGNTSLHLLDFFVKILCIFGSRPKMVSKVVYTDSPGAF